MSCARYWLLILVAQLSVVFSPVFAADSVQPQACINVAKRSPDGSSSDRFLREWCQRNLAKSAETTPAEPQSAAPSQTHEQPALAPQSAPAAEIPSAPSYPGDNSYDEFNSSRLPPGYHCHMLKFGERICHGGLD